MTRRKARKTHECFYCNCQIEPGTVYHNESFLYGGGWETCKWCVDCDEVLRHWAPDYNVEENPGSDLWDHLYCKYGLDGIARNVVLLGYTGRYWRLGPGQSEWSYRYAINILTSVLEEASK